MLPRTGTRLTHVFVCGCLAVLLAKHGEKIAVIPVDGWTNFNFKATHKVLTIEEVEEIMKPQRAGAKVRACGSYQS